MRKKSCFILALCIVVSTAGFAQKKDVDLTQEMKLDKTVRHGKLENGLTYYIKSNKKPENRAEFYLAVNAGSILETDDQQGLAHFTEHMAFNGTRQFPGNEMINTLQKNGIQFGRDNNAYTAFDETVYNLTLPTDKPELFNLGLKVLDGFANGMLMVGKEIDAERGVIVEEWRTGIGAGERIRRVLWPKILAGSKYAVRLPIGTKENLDTFHYSSIRNFYKTWYRPDNEAIIIVGDFDADSMEKVVIDYFTMRDNPSTPLVRPLEGIPDNAEPIVVVASDKELTSTDVAILYKHPAKKMKTVGDFRDQELKTALYESMIASRLSEKTNNKKCPYLGAQSGYMSTFIARTVGGYISEATAKDGKALDALKTLMEENERVIRYGFLQTELDRAKESVLEQYERASKEANKTDNDVFARQYVQNFLVQQPVVGARQEYRWAKSLMDGITLEEINALAKEWITDKNIVCYITMPESKKIPSEKDVLKIIKSASSMNVTPYVDTYKEVPFFAENPKVGKISSEKKDSKFDYTEWKLSNGATVVLKPTTIKDDEIQMSMWSKGGSSLYPDADMINVQYAAGIIDGSGIGQMDHNQLHKFQSKHTFGTEPYIGELSEGMTGSCAPKDIEYLMQYTYMYFTSPRMDKEIFDARIDALKSQLKVIQNSPDVQFALAMQKAMYPNDKRTIAIPTEKQISQMNLDKMYKIFRERFSNAGDFTFEFVGNFKIEDMKPLVEKYIASLPSTGKHEEWKDVSAPFASGVVDKKVYAGTEDKSTMAIILHRPYTLGQRENAVTNILGEIAEIRCLQYIREELGVTYSPYMSVDYEREPKPEFVAMGYYSLAPKNVDATTKATFDLFDEFANKGVSEENLNKAKEQLIKHREASYTSSNNFWLSSITSHYRYGTEILDMDAYKSLINSITAEEVQACAKKYLSKDAYVKVTLLPKTAEKK